MNVKTLKVIFVIVSLFVSIVAKAGDIVIENPPFTVCTVFNLEIDKVKITEKETLITFSYYFPKEHTEFSLDRKSFLAVGEKQLPIQSSTIKLNQKYTKGKGKENVLTFSLKFDPIDPSTEKIDFLESLEDVGTRFWGIELKSKTITTREEVPQLIREQAENKADTTSLRAEPFNKNVAILRGKLYGFTPDMQFKAMFLRSDVLQQETGFNDIRLTTIQENGEWRIGVPLTTTQAVHITILGQNYTVVLSPGETSQLHFDLQQRCANDSRNRTDMEKEKDYMFFLGANADINNQINTYKMIPYVDPGSMTNRDHSDMKQKQFANMTANEYRDYIFTRLEEDVKYVEENTVNKRGQDFIKLHLRQLAMIQLSTPIPNIEGSFTQFINKSLTGYVAPRINLRYYSFYNILDVNNPVNMFGLRCSEMISSINRMAAMGGHPVEMFVMNPDEREKDVLTKMSALLGTGNGFVFDMLVAQEMLSRVGHGADLDASRLQMLDNMADPFYKTYIERFAQDIKEYGSK